jgi:predicted esterase
MTYRPLSCLALALSLLPACGTSDADGANSESGEETAADAESESGETTSDETGSEADTGESTEDTGETGMMGECPVLSEGMNQIDVNGTTRMFILNLPDGADAGGPWPVVFNWHGLGDSAQNMSGLISGQVNGPNYQFIGVTPEDADFQLGVPGLGNVNMDWEIFMASDDNPEMAMFDRIVECVDAQFGVDADRIHSMGFSLGGITSDLLGTMRGDQIASIATYSGGYWHDPQSVIGLVATVVNWPEHTTSNTYAQLFLHGGSNDTYPLGPVTIEFSSYAIDDAAWLDGKGHAIYLCDHGGGHTAPPAAMGPDKLMKFFADHPRGAASPYAGALPGDWPDYCAEVMP